MGSEFGARSTTEDVLEGVDLTGRRAVVTGATSGLGLETARALASRGAEVVILGRSEEKLAAAERHLAEQDVTGAVRTSTLDLDDLDNVRASADTLLSRFDAIDILVNNAGVMVCPYGTTAQGFETQFGTNHLGHFLFTCRLAPALVAGAPCRVINLASSGHRAAPLDFDDPNFQKRPYEKWSAYGGSKTANVLFTVALDARLKSKGVRALAVHPGMIATDLGRHLTGEDMSMFAEPPERFKTIPRGAATTVWAATSPELQDVGGVYLADCQIAEVNDTDDPARGVKSYAISPEDAERLWHLSETLVGETFDL
jgi:NAD(P)-dependent dehydrogenase (short-subunit alcohol dehydrogenase family)